jgi:hypothetical protein
MIEETGPQRRDPVIPMRLQRRGGRKLIMTPEGAWQGSRTVMRR